MSLATFVHMRGVADEIFRRTLSEINVHKVLANRLEIHCLRDLTRGGLGGALVEIAEAARRRIDVDERSIPVREDVQGACEILGLDPLHVANEGRFLVILPAAQADEALRIMHSHPLGRDATRIGTVRDEHAGMATLESRIGVQRIIDMLSGEQLPRIC